MEVSIIDDETLISYKKEDFTEGTAPFDDVYMYHDNKFRERQAIERMAAMAKTVGVMSFKAMYTDYLRELKQLHEPTVNYTQFENQPMELQCGEWIANDNGVITITRPNDEKENRALHGLTRTLLNNMVVGVTEGYKKELDVNGVGYRVAKEGKKLTMNIGYSHPVVMEEIDGITIDVPSPNKIIINGIDKQKVGQFAAEVRGKRPPEPYKGKGIKYTDEVIRRKEGKTGVKK